MRWKQNDAKMAFKMLTKKVDVKDLKKTAIWNIFISKAKHLCEINYELLQGNYMTTVNISSYLKFNVSQVHLLFLAARLIDRRFLFVLLRLKRLDFRYGDLQVIFFVHFLDVETGIRLQISKRGKICLSCARRYARAVCAWQPLVLTIL